MSLAETVYVSSWKLAGGSGQSLLLTKVYDWDHRGRLWNCGGKIWDNVSTEYCVTSEKIIFQNWLQNRLLLSTIWIWLFRAFLKYALFHLYKSFLPTNLSSTSTSKFFMIILNANVIIKYQGSGCLEAFHSLWTTHHPNSLLHCNFISCSSFSPCSVTPFKTLESHLKGSINIWHLMWPKPIPF